MKVLVEKSFAKDFDKIRDKKILRSLSKVISDIENSKSLKGIPNLTKIKGYDSFFRIRIGDYRMGLELKSNTSIGLIRILHRKEIYRYFPQK